MKELFRSFAGGEITPELFGRLDLTKFQTGLRTATNFITLPHGPAVRRPGTKYVLQARDSTKRVRLVPFQYSAADTVVIELGHMYARFHLNGATILEANKAIVSITGDNVQITAHAYSVGDWLFIGGKYFIVAAVVDANNVEVTDLRGDTGAPAPASTTAARVYKLTTPYDEAHIFDIHYAQNNAVLTLTHPEYKARELARVSAASWTLTAVDFTPTLAAPGGVGVVATVAVATNLSPQKYVVTAVSADGVTESLASSVVTASNNLTLAGNYNTVSWSAATGAARYNVYKQRGGSFGYIGQTTSLSIIDDNVTPDLGKVPPEQLITLNTGSDGSGVDLPATVTYHEQRRWLAGTEEKPQNVFATRNGTEANLTSSLPSQADDALAFRAAALQRNQIRHLVPLSDLMALTANGEWRIYADNEPAITPTSLTVKPLGYSGASNVQPVTTSGSILYVQSQGSRVRELAYADNGYRSIDMSIMAPHMFNSYTLVDMAYARAPEQLMWAVRSDGALLGLTYVPEQQVYGWHKHTTDGEFESVCVVAEGSEDVLYVVVKRTIGETDYRYIERLQSRLFGSLANAYFVDGGLTYSGAPAMTFSGLDHLEGKTVQVLADGAVEPDQVVEDGAITLDFTASVVHIGLKYISDMQTLPLAFETVEAAGQGMLKNVLAAHLRVTETSLFKVGPSLDKLVPNRSRAVSDPFNSAPSLKTKEERVQVAGSWNTDGSIFVRQDQPLPCTVVAMMLEVEDGD